MVLRNCYKNWLPLLILYLMGMLPDKIFLRNGLVLSLNSRDTIHGIIANLFGLAVLLQNGWSIKNANDGSLVMYHSSMQIEIKCRLNNGADLYHLVEIFVEKRYSSFFEGKVILDVGMSNADSAIYFAKNGALLVIGLEPSPDSFALATENVKINNLQKVIIPLNVALASRSGMADFLVSSRETNGDRLDGVSLQSFKYDSKIDVRTTTIDNLVQEFELSRIDLLKMDCEGCEHDALLNLNSGALDRISEIIAETHGSSNKISNFLSRNHFQVRMEFDTNLHAKKLA